MRTAAFIACALLMCVAPLSAQSFAMSDERRTNSAMELELEALKLHGDRDQYARAASLYLEAAGLRAPSDPMVVHDYRMAARLFYYDDDGEGARTTMEAAGDAALRMGDVVEAAQAFLDAAWLAMHRNNVAEVERLAERAELLMSSPIVPEEQKAAVLNRIERRTGGFLNVRRGMP